MMKDSRYSLLYCVLMAFAIFTFLVTLDTLEDVFGLSRRPGISLSDFWRSFWGWNTWVPTVPVAYWLVRKHLDGKSKNWQIVLYIFTGTMLVIVYKALILNFLYSLYFPNRKESYAVLEIIWHSLIDRRSIIETIIFWFILAAIYALQYSRLLQVREKQEHLLKTELAQAHLHALKLQLQPHFLFNTLNSISSLLREKVKPEHLQSNMQAADNMLTNLSEMFRHTLSTAEINMTPLRDELVFLENYLAIEKIRFAEKLTIEMNIDPTLHAVEVPAFILQPIVENSIRHGTSKQAQVGVIRITIQKHETNLKLCVTDNGNCSKDDLKDIFNNGVGLQNTKKRLTHLYGDQFTFSIAKNDKQETQVDIMIPLEAPHSATIKDIP